MSIKNLVKEVDIVYLLPAVSSANNSDDHASSAVIDMSGWDGALIVSDLGATSTIGAVSTLNVYGHTANAASGAVITGATATWTAVGTNDNLGKVLVVDVYRPTKRYLYAGRTTATQVATLGVCYAILYRSRKEPRTLTSALASTFLVGV